MIVIQTVLALLIHSLGRVFNMAFGWATVMLFGRVPQERQIFLSVVALGSIVWLTAVIGVAFPAAAAFLLAFVSLPPWVHHTWIRIVMMIAVLVVPPLVGESSIRAIQPDMQPMGWSRVARALVSGYRVTSGIAFALGTLMLVAPVLSIRNLMRRWTTRHIPIVVQRDDYLEVLEQVQGVLAAAGMPPKRSPAGGILRLPTAILAFTTGRKIRGLDTEAARLSTGWVEIFLYPFDLVISGDKLHVSQAQSVVAERLPLTRAYMTWSTQGQCPGGSAEAYSDTSGEAVGCGLPGCRGGYGGDYSGGGSGRSGSCVGMPALRRMGGAHPSDADDAAGYPAGGAAIPAGISKSGRGGKLLTQLIRQP